MTESAGVAAFAAVFIYREVKPREILTMSAEGMKAASGVSFIIMFALLLAHRITGSGVPTALVEFATDSNLESWQFLLALNILMLIMACFLILITYVPEISLWLPNKLMN